MSEIKQQGSASSGKGNSKWVWCGSFGLVVLACAAIWWMLQGQFAVAASSAEGGQGAPVDQVLAVIDGETVTRLELAGQLGSGVDRAIVVDRYINKVIAAQRGKALFPEEAVAAVRAAEREVLSTVYTTRRMQEIRDQIADEELQSYYDDNVRDEEFVQWKVSYYLTTDAQDVQNTLTKLRQGDSKALDKLELLNANNEGFLTARAMPYGLGRVVSSLEVGVFSEVLRVRNGFMVVRVDDQRQLTKPTLDEGKNPLFVMPASTFLCKIDFTIYKISAGPAVQRYLNVSINSNVLALKLVFVVSF